VLPTPAYAQRSQPPKYAGFNRQGLRYLQGSDTYKFLVCPPEFAAAPGSLHRG
jgi:hypothetical protein